MSRPSGTVSRWLVLGGLLVAALLLAGVASHYASGEPDGLERVAADEGFAATERAPATAGSPLAGYGADAGDEGRLTPGLAGVTGALVVLLVATGVTRAVRRRGPARDVERDRDDLGVG